MKLFFILLLSFVSVFANAQKEKFTIAIQAQPELTFYKSKYGNTFDVHNSSSFNKGFNIYGQYQITDRLFITLGLGFISRKLNTFIDIHQPYLPEPYYDTNSLGIFTNEVSYRVLQIPLGFGYDFLKTKRSNVFAGLVFIPNFLLNARYGTILNYPAFKKNYWQGYSVNPNIGFDHALTHRIAITGAIAYSVVNTVRAEEYSSKHPELEHRYLQLSLGLKLKFYKAKKQVPLCPVSVN